MEIHQLQYFIHVYEQGSFTRASSIIGISQAGVSAQIAKLEQELGYPVFFRESKKIQLTKLGEELVPLARRVLSAIAALEEKVQTMLSNEQGMQGTVKIGTVTSYDAPPFLQALSNFRSDFPQVKITIHEDDSMTLQEQILKRELDIAVISTSRPVLDGIEIAALSIEKPVVLALPSHPLAYRERVELRDLCGHALLSLPRRSGTWESLEQSCVQLGITLEIDVEASSPETIVNLAKHGFGACIVPESITDKALMTIPITNAQVPITLGIATRREAEIPAVVTMRKYMLQYILHSLQGSVDS